MDLFFWEKVIVVIKFLDSSVLGLDTEGLFSILFFCIIAPILIPDFKKLLKDFSVHQKFNLCIAFKTIVIKTSKYIKHINACIFQQISITQHLCSIINTLD